MEFLHHPRRVAGRKIIFFVHLWTGLIIGFFLMVVGLSGSLLVFNDDIQKHFAVHAGPYDQAAALGIADLASRAHRLFPTAQISYISLAAAPGDVAMVSTQDPVTHRGGDISFHPRTGQVLAETVTHEAFFDWVYRVHVYLLAGDSGYFCNGIMAALGTGLCSTGLIIWWPGLKHWRSALAVNRRARWKRINYDLHRSVGFFCSIALGVVLLTGAYFRFPEPFNYVLQAMTRSKVQTFNLDMPERSLPFISVTQALAAGESALPGGSTASLGLPRRDLHYFRVDRKLPNGELRTVAVDGYTGAVLNISSEHPLSLPDRILALAGPIHFGTWGGRVTQVLWVFLGLTPGVLFVTGLLMYWNRVLSKKMPRRGRGVESLSEARVHATVGAAR